MILLLASYTNMSSSPNLIIRFVYLIALLLPIINNIELLPSVLICTLSISYSTFAFPFMPTDSLYYVVILLFFGIFSALKQNSVRISPIFLLLLLFVFFNDILLQQHISRLTTNLFLCLLMFVCVGNKQGSSNYHISLAFMMVSLVLSYWILFRPEAQIEVKHIVEGIESYGWADPNYLGGIIGIGCVVAVKELLHNSSKKLVFWVLCLTTIIGSVLSLAYLASRGAFLATGVGIIAMITMSKSKLLTKILMVASIVIMVVLMYTSNVFELLIARTSAVDTTGSGRTNIWLAKVHCFFAEGNLIKWLFGFGQEEGFWLGHFGRPRAFHNDFIAVLVEYGFFGFFIFMSILVYPIRKAEKQKRPTIIAFLLYLITLGMTLEPLTGGNLVFLAFYFYITQIVRYSKQVETINEQK